jgi:squalene-hopene/tetraprenyl-beta-curcumene cyclase
MAEISAPPALAALPTHRRPQCRARRLQQPDGHFVFELEADATIPSEYIFLNRYLGESEPEREAELADYIRSVQSDSHDGWPLYHGGKFNLSCSVKAYYALKMVGDEPAAPHMVRARNAILAHGGAERSNVFTRYSLAMSVACGPVPAMPVERC